MKRWMVTRPGPEVAVAGAMAFVLFFIGTAQVPLIPRDEARFAEAAREMLARGDLVVPTFAGVNRYDKPILIYWCVSASYFVFGVNERAARLPSNITGAMTVLLLAWTARAPSPSGPSWSPSSLHPCHTSAWRCCGYYGHRCYRQL